MQVCVCEFRLFANEDEYGNKCCIVRAMDRYMGRVSTGKAARYLRYITSSNTLTSGAHSMSIKKKFGNPKPPDQDVLDHLRNVDYLESAHTRCR